MLRCDIRSHLESIHGKYQSKSFGPKRPYQCYKCDVALKQPVELSDHQCKIKIKRKFKKNCPYCDKILSSKDGLSRHLKRMHHKNQKHVTCDMCDYHAPYKQLLSQHVRRVHEKDRRHVCSSCGKAYFSTHELAKHEEKAHFGYYKDAELKCDTCSVTFGSIGELP